MDGLNRSNLGVAAIDEKLDCIDEAAVVAGQKHHCLGDLVWCTHTAQGDEGSLTVDEPLELAPDSTPVRHSLEWEQRRDRRHNRLFYNAPAIEKMPRWSSR